MTDPDGTSRTQQLVAFISTRLVLSTAYRMVFPFLPVFARGLGVSLETVSLVIGIRSAMGLAGPVLGAFADTRSRKRAMLEGLALFVFGMGLVSAVPTLLFFSIGLVLSGVGNIIVDSAIYAFIGDRVPYAHRGRAIAIIEIGWSAAFIVGIPIAGWLISRSGWHAPFPFLAGLGLAAALWLRRVLPSGGGTAQRQPSARRSLYLIRSQSTAVFGLLVTLLLLAANQCVNIVYGAWMERSHGLQVAELGAASAVIGVAGIGGVALAATVPDRIGKRRAIALGVGVNILLCLALPVLEVQLPLVLSALFLFYLSFEFALVSSIPLMTQLVPSARATLMAANVAAIAAGDAVGAFIGPYLFRMGFGANALTAATLNIGALSLLIWRVRVSTSAEHQPEGAAPPPEVVAKEP
jgi:predicted MFS family arabinose efflux permease